MPRNEQRIAIISVVLALAATVPSAQQRAPDLDITSLDRPLEDNGPETFTGEVIGGVAEGRVVQSPLQVRLLRLEPDSCTSGEPISYDVELRNAGRTDLLLPWSVDARDEGMATTGFFPVLSLSLAFREGRAQSSLGSVERLFGNNFNALTTRTLRPREAVVVRAGAECRTIGGVETGGDFGPGSRRLRVTARTVFWYRGNTVGPSAESSNAIELTMTWPGTP